MGNSWRAFWLIICVAIGAGNAYAARVSDVRGTKHNLSSVSDGSPTPSGGTVPTRTVKATTETQICVFCHTPHGATPGVAPLWNRKLSEATYTPYSSLSLDAETIRGAVLAQPAGSSKLCLSCHDGTLAIGSVNVLNGAGSNTTQGTRSITMSGTGTGGTMPAGSGSTTGFTRLLGTDLGNDHPISVDYTTALADRDGELRQVDSNQKYPNSTGEIIGVRRSGYKPKLPLEPTGTNGIGQVECATCHDPHTRETDTTKGNQKFLRVNRFQEAQPTANYSVDNDIICLGCHDKAGASWAYSAHANSLVTTQTYDSTAPGVSQREFPANLPVWRAACLNCHDTHTVQGARRLLREGTDNTSTPKAGGNPALEETCYQCHTSTGAVITPLTTVPNIKSDFTTAGNKRMPITGTEMHNIGGNFSDATFVDCTTSTNKCGKDMIEQRTLLGSGGNLTNRHAECTDCHNPHRVVKFKDFRGSSASGSLVGLADASGTHPHTDTAMSHTNIASGVLRGAWGVEPIYSSLSASFHLTPTGYTVKRGDPAGSTDATVGATHVTREYQICLKCHSDYGYSDDNNYPTGTRPNLGYTGGTTSGTNNLTQYTNQAKEFQAPAAHKGELTTTDSGAGASYTTNNHRGWHPVMDSTGRTATIRGNGTDISARWNAPWSNGVGTQTMYCTDCHGSNVTSSTSVIPDGGENGSPWGPHGSANNFILKGLWNTSTGSGQQATGLCFKCHNYTSYATNSGNRTGFYLTDIGKDGHTHHADKIGRLRCNWCHVAVPHGWKNKALLVNLNDVGPEGGLAAGTQVRNNTTAAYNNGPYYMNAINKIRTFRPSGQWTAASCGSAGAPGNGQSGRNWMRDSNENCTNPP